MRKTLTILFSLLFLFCFTSLNHPAGASDRYYDEINRFRERERQALNYLGEKERTLWFHQQLWLKTIRDLKIIKAGLVVSTKEAVPQALEDTPLNRYYVTMLGREAELSIIKMRLQITKNAIEARLSRQLQSLKLAGFDENSPITGQHQSSSDSIMKVFGLWQTRIDHDLAQVTETLNSIVETSEANRLKNHISENEAIMAQRRFEFFLSLVSVPMEVLENGFASAILRSERFSQALTRANDYFISFEFLLTRLSIFLRPLANTDQKLAALNMRLRYAESRYKKMLITLNEATESVNSKHDDPNGDERGDEPEPVPDVPEALPVTPRENSIIETSSGRFEFHNSCEAKEGEKLVAFASKEESSKPAEGNETYTSFKQEYFVSIDPGAKAIREINSIEFGAALKNLIDGELRVCTTIASGTRPGSATHEGAPPVAPHDPIAPRAIEENTDRILGQIEWARDHATRSQAENSSSATTGTSDAEDLNQLSQEVKRFAIRFSAMKERIETLSTNSIELAQQGESLWPSQTLAALPELPTGPPLLTKEEQEETRSRFEASAKAVSDVLGGILLGTPYDVSNFLSAILTDENLLGERQDQIDKALLGAAVVLDLVVPMVPGKAAILKKARGLFKADILNAVLVKDLLKTLRNSAPTAAKFVDLSTETIKMGTTAGLKTVNEVLAFDPIAKAFKNIDVILHPKRIRVGEPGKYAIIARTMGSAEKPGIDFVAAEMRQAGFEVKTFSKPQTGIDKKLEEAFKEFEDFASNKAGEGLGRLTEVEVKTTKLFQLNQEWAESLIKEGHTILDLGDPYGLNLIPEQCSVWYKMEQQVIFGEKLW